ncbi:MAG TPA: hypothetical protein DCG49_07400 [Ruminococcus sp.]|nr:hypothetical protein [Ruminococcus sp.]
MSAQDRLQSYYTKYSFKSQTDCLNFRKKTGKIGFLKVTIGKTSKHKVIGFYYSADIAAIITRLSATYTQIRRGGQHVPAAYLSNCMMPLWEAFCIKTAKTMLIRAHFCLTSRKTCSKMEMYLTFFIVSRILNLYGYIQITCSLLRRRDAEREVHI